MKKYVLASLLFLVLMAANGQDRPFRFAFISDTHIGSPNGSAEEDLRRTVRDINAQEGIAFVVLTGDITELGTNEELQTARAILDSLNIPWYILPGNHDTGWSESGGQMFITVFGYDKFSFEHNGIRFLGCASGPYVRMGDGHVPRDAVNWLEGELQKLRPGQPVIFLNHYPIDNGLDNWYEVTDRLRRHNTWAILCGHGHANRAMQFEDIPGVMGRSNLRARAAVGGYNIVDVRTDSILFFERKPGNETLRKWTGIRVENRSYDQHKKFPRPDFTINDKYKQVTPVWTFSSEANVISTPVIAGGKVIFGNQNGRVQALSLADGSPAWSFQTSGSIFSSPASYRNRVVFGSSDGNIYCLNSQSGNLYWKMQAGAPVLGSPVIHNKKIYIGSSKSFLSLQLRSGKEMWRYMGIRGPVVSTPVFYKQTVLFGAWDTYLYSLNRANGELQWKWNNGSPVRNFSPAACIPAVLNDRVYVVAPDRYITAIDAEKGTTIWRNNDTRIRESIGFSEDGNWVYGKTMQDTVVAYRESGEKQVAAWKMHLGFGYEHVPSMLIEKEGYLFFGTKNGVVYCIRPESKELIWAHKIDNSMVNTVRVQDKHTVLAATMDGKVVLLKAKGY